MSGHAHDAHTEPKKAEIKSNFPKSFIIIIVLILGAMVYYSSYTRPENTVLNYFDSISKQDYTATADCLSVFVMAMQLPEYASPSITGKELLALRSEVVEAYASHLAGNSLSSSDAIVKPIKQYTKIGRNAAIVVFDLTFEEQNPTLIAHLIKEANKFRIIDIYEIENSAAFREEIDRVDINKLDQEAAALYK